MCGSNPVQSTTQSIASDSGQPVGSQGDDKRPPRTILSVFYIANDGLSLSGSSGGATRIYQRGVTQMVVHYLIISDRDRLVVV